MKSHEEYVKQLKKEIFDYLKYLSKEEKIC